jgi:hypothetical protein
MPNAPIAITWTGRAPKCSCRAAPWCKHVIERVITGTDHIRVKDPNVKTLIDVPLSSQPRVSSPRELPKVTIMIDAVDGGSGTHPIWLATAPLPHTLLTYVSLGNLTRRELGAMCHPILANWIIKNPCACGELELPRTPKDFHSLACQAAYRFNLARFAKNCSECTEDDLLPDIQPAGAGSPRGGWTRPAPQATSYASTKFPF